MASSIPSELVVAAFGFLGGVVLAVLNRKPTKATVAEIYSKLHEDLLGDLEERKKENRELREELDVVRDELREVKALLNVAIKQMKAAGLPTDGFNI